MWPWHHWKDPFALTQLTLKPMRNSLLALGSANWNFAVGRLWEEWWDHRITESQGLEENSGDHPEGSSPSAKKVSYSRLHREVYRQVLNIWKEGDSITTLGSLVQCSVTLKIKKTFLMFYGNSFVPVFCPLSLFCWKGPGDIHYSFIYFLVLIRYSSVFSSAGWTAPGL